MTRLQTRFTPQDLLAMPDGDRFELVAGRLVERPMGTRAAAIGGELFLLLRLFLKDHPGGPVESAIQVLREGDELDGGDVLPGFRCRVGDLFAV